MSEKKKHSPGEKRTPGTKDYALILGNLIKHRNNIPSAKSPEAVIILFERIAEKLQELGFRPASKKVLSQTRSTANLDSKIEKVGAIVSEKWHEGKEKHEKAREKAIQKK